VAISPVELKEARVLPLKASRAPEGR